MKNLKCHIPIIILTFLLTYTIHAQDDLIKITDNLELQKITDNTYLHISYQDYPNADKIPANGLIYINKGEAFIIDTPWTDDVTKDLLAWLQNTMEVKVKGVITTHWHIDCMGGLNEVQNAGIKSFANYKTYEIAESKKLHMPEECFKDSLVLQLNGKLLICKYLGGGHTVDNMVVWLPEEKILFGGCLLKALGWKTLGFIVDADIKAWPVTLNKLLTEFPSSKIVIPGHGDHGDLNLVYHTIDLLKGRD